MQYKGIKLYYATNQLRELNLSICLIFPAALVPGFIQPLTEMLTRSRKMFVGSIARPVHKADNCNAICEPNGKTMLDLEPYRPLRPALLYFYESEVPIEYQICQPFHLKDLGRNVRKFVTHCDACRYSYHSPAKSESC
jgi:hypothetical protein